MNTIKAIRIINDTIRAIKVIQSIIRPEQYNQSNTISYTVKAIKSNMISNIIRTNLGVV